MPHIIYNQDEPTCDILIFYDSSTSDSCEFSCTRRRFWTQKSGFVTNTGANTSLTGSSCTPGIIIFVKYYYSIPTITKSGLGLTEISSVALYKMTLPSGTELNSQTFLISSSLSESGYTTNFSFLYVWIINLKIDNVYLFLHL